MKNLYCFLLCVFMPFYLYPQVTQEWVARYTGPGDYNDAAKSIAVDEYGNVYVTGESEQSSRDCATIKYNPSGGEEWVKIYNGPENRTDYGVSIAVDGLGDAYVLAMSSGIYAGQDYYVTLKYSTVLGGEMWKNTYSQCNSPTALALDNLANVYVTGGGYAGGTSGNDFTTIKYNSSGGELWVQRYSGPDSMDDGAYSIAVDDFGNVYVTGASRNYDQNSDYATVKYNTDGVQQWAMRYNGPGNDIARSIAVDDSGNVYVTGESEGNGYATIKYNSAGVPQWFKTLGGSPNDVAYSIAVDGSGNVYVTGKIFFSATSDDYTTVKYSTDGTLNWVARYDGPGSMVDVAYSIAIDGFGNVYVTGGSTDSSYNEDYATIKYNSIGAEIWVQRYNGSGNGQDRADDIVVDNSGNVYVTGLSWGDGMDYATIKYSQPVNVETTSNEIPDDFVLFQNFPNPFNPSTVISYQLPVSSNVTLKVYDVLGNEIETLVNEEKPAGTYEVTWYAENLPSGVYFYQLLVSALQSKDGKAGSFVETKKMILIR